MLVIHFNNRRFPVVSVLVTPHIPSVYDDRDVGALFSQENIVKPRLLVSEQAFHQLLQKQAEPRLSLTTFFRVYINGFLFAPYG